MSATPYVRRACLRAAGRRARAPPFSSASVAAGRGDLPPTAASASLSSPVVSPFTPPNPDPPGPHLLSPTFSYLSRPSCASLLKTRASFGARVVVRLAWISFGRADSVHLAASHHLFRRRLSTVASPLGRSPLSSCRNNPAITNMIFSLGGASPSSLLSSARPSDLSLTFSRGTLPARDRLTAMQVARKVPTDDPQVLFYLRIAYISIRAWRRTSGPLIAVSID